MLLSATLSPSFSRAILPWSAKCTKASFYIFEYLRQRDPINSTTISSSEKSFKGYVEPSKPNIKSLGQTAIAQTEAWSLKFHKGEESLFDSSPCCLHPCIPSLCTYHLPGTVGTMMNKADSLPSKLLENKFQVEMWPMAKGPQQDTWKDRKQVAKSFFTTL